MKSIKISVITIAYNAAETIQRTINSILAQNYDNIEYIVVDGNSQDETLDIVTSNRERFDKNGISLVINSEPDKGISDAFNKGLKLVTGDIISFLNADDWYENNTLTLVANIFHKQKVDFCYGNLYMYNKDERIRLLGRPVSTFKSRYTMPVMHPTFFMSKHVYDEVGLFRLDYKCAMDYDYVLRILEHRFRGEYVRNLYVNMQDGGAHKANYWYTLGEVAQISISHGGNSVLAQGARIYTYCRNV